MSDELIPKVGDINVAKRVFDILGQVITDKTSLGLEDKWFRFYELGKNKHWRKNVPGLTLSSANLLSVHRRRTVNTLTDNNPTFNIRRVTGKGDTDDVFKTILRATEYWWNETEQQDILELSVWNGETYGVCIEKSVFDVDKEFGIGEVDTVVVDPFHFGIYPTKCLDVQKAQAVFHYYPMSVRDIKRRYGAAAADVVADTDAINNLDSDRRAVSGLKDTIIGSSTTGSTSFGGILRKLSAYVNSQGQSDGDEAVVVECWVKDYSVDADKNFIYPGNIRVITAVNGSITLSDRLNPSINPRLDPALASLTYLYDKFPFVKANSNKDPVNFWGESDFEQLAGLQMEFNKSLSQFSSLKDKVAGVKLINPVGSGVSNDQMTTGATVINPSNPNHGIGYVSPPPIPRELIESMNMNKELFFAVAGTFDLEQANTPGSQVIAYKAIAALLERASTMMRGKIRNYGKLMRERGRMAVSQMQNWYTEDRYIGFMDNGVEESDIAYGPDMIIPMKLSVVSGSTMPRSEVQKREESLTLFDKGAIDILELLTSLDWNKPHEVVTRMQEGPVNAFISKMTMAGMPPEMAEFMSTIAAIDEKKLERKVERHEIPLFSETFVFQGMEPDAKKQLDIAKAQADVKESEARSKKMYAEEELTRVRALVEQDSIRQANAKLSIERAKVVSDAKLKSKEIKTKSEETKEATVQ